MAVNTSLRFWALLINVDDTSLLMILFGMRGGYCYHPCGLLLSSIWTIAIIHVDYCYHPCGLLLSSMWTIAIIHVDYCYLLCGLFISIVCVDYCYHPLVSLKLLKKNKQNCPKTIQIIVQAVS